MTPTAVDFWPHCRNIYNELYLFYTSLWYWFNNLFTNNIRNRKEKQYSIVGSSVEKKIKTFTCVWNGIIINWFFQHCLFLRITTLLTWLKSTLLLKIKCFGTTIYMKTQCLQTNETQHYGKGKCLRSMWFWISRRWKQGGPTKTNVIIFAANQTYFNIVFVYFRLLIEI